MKPFEVSDLRLHRKVVDMHGIDSHPCMFATTRSVDSENDSYATEMWSFKVGGGGPERFACGNGSDSSPKISPDGTRVAFISDRDGSGLQIFVSNIDGKNPQQVGSFLKGASSFHWSPDSLSLYVLANVGIEPDDRGGGVPTAKERGERAPEICWKLPYKSDGMGYLLAKVTRLYRLILDTGHAEALTGPDFDVAALDPSPNGKSVAYVRNRAGKFAHLWDLWMCDADGRNHRRLTSTLSSVIQPAWSADGGRIAFAGSEKQGDGELRLWIFDLGAGTLACVDPEMEIALPELLRWDGAGKILVARGQRGRHEIARLDPTAVRIEVLAAGDRQFGCFAVGSDGFAFSEETPVRPSEIRSCDMSGKNEVQISHFNPWWQERLPVQLEARYFEVPDGRGRLETIEGWLLRAKGREGPLPLLVDVHGGPASYALLDFDTNVFWHALCSRGWTVLMLNAVGSSSFGSEFCRRLSGHWGELDLPQYQTAIEQLQAEGLCDDRVSISGKSYGGYFTSWAIGHTDMFKSAVVMVPVGNIETHYGTSDGGYYADPLYIDTLPRLDRHRARELSPLQFVEAAKTPALFLQGKDDERCPKCQSEELFVSLYNAGDTPAELVLYPGEGHAFLGEGRPACREDAAGRIVSWVTQWGLEVGTPEDVAVSQPASLTARHSSPTLQKEAS